MSNLSILLAIAATLVADLATRQTPDDQASVYPVCQTADRLNPPFDFGRPLVVGEFHGTEQSAPFVTDLVCTALAQGRKVSLAVEMPPAAVAAALAPGAADEFWSPEFPDGRSSRAMHGMLEAFREVEANGDVKLLGFQAVGDQANTPEASAARVQAGSRAGDVLIVLAGDFHARRPSGEDEGPTLTSALGDVVNVKIANSQPGSAWACMPVCGSQTLPGGSGRLPLGFNRVSAANGFDYFYVVETYTLSPPFAGP